jgi:FdhD protein
MDLLARPGAVTRRPTQRVVDGVASRRVEDLATEEPLEIRVEGQAVAVTMRTPGADFELAVGFLHGEGVVTRTEDVRAVRYCADRALRAEQRFNVVTVDLAEGLDLDLDRLSRHVLTSSACGVCGSQSVEALADRGLAPVPAGDPWPAALVAGLPDLLRAGQSVFDRTGGLHAAGLVDRSGALLAVREDVGRHNAVDKLVGWALLQGRLPLRDVALVVSGRASYELAQKAVAAGIPLLASVSAPSSLAVALAERYGMALAGFVREGRLTIYAGAERVALEPR